MRMALLYSGSADSARADDADTLEEMAELETLAQELGWQTQRLSYEQPRDRLVAALGEAAPQVVLNLVQSAGGSDATIYEATALLDELGLPYTGNGTECLRRIATKPEMKSLLQAAGIPTARWVSEEEAAHAPAGRYIVKSESEHCSLGIDATSIVASTDIAATIADRKARFGGRWFAETYLDGREFNVSIIPAEGRGIQVMPMAELTFTDMPEGIPPIVDYAGKWDEDAPSFVHLHRVFPAAEGTLAQIPPLARATWEACGMRGYGRIDFRTDAAGNPWVIDVNANPCLNSGVGVMAAAEQAAIAPKDVLKRIINAALAT